MSFKETGRLTLRMFKRLYGHYKDTFDLEMRLSKANMTYAELEKKANATDEWF